MQSGCNITLTWFWFDIWNVEKENKLLLIAVGGFVGMMMCSISTIFLALKVRIQNRRRFKKDRSTCIPTESIHYSIAENSNIRFIEKVCKMELLGNPSLTAKKTTMMVLTVIYIKSHSWCLPIYMVFKIRCRFHHLQQWKQKALEMLHIFASWHFQIHVRMLCILKICKKKKY